MPNIKSAIKRVLVNEKKAVANKSKKSELRTIVKKAKSSLEAPTAETASAVRVAQVNLDKAATKGYIHKNNAAHKKSQLAKAVNKIG
ncbi:MAG TPA: 30S ribosomal protein S20, partial [Clostridia bacterium]